jgi:hypothetical protein
VFPGAEASVYRNEAGEPLGWDYPSYDSGEDWMEEERRLGGYTRRCKSCGAPEDDCECEWTCPKCALPEGECECEEDDD